MTPESARLSSLRGKLLEQAPLAPYTWFRVGGPADLLFLPADDADLAAALAIWPSDAPLSVLGVGSNTIVRDGGVDGLMVRLVGGYWGQIEQVSDTDLFVRAGALDLTVARAAATRGIAGLSFLSGIPGALGGAVRTNAGCYGRELKDCLVRIDGRTRSGGAVSFQGELEELGLPRVTFGYRHSDFPEDVIITGLTLRGSGPGDPAALRADIEAHQARRAETQPIREKTGGSTFANPDPPDHPAARSSWKLVDAAGCRGLRVGGAQVSEKHCNFLINTGTARAADIEALGELVRARVLEQTGVKLRWEIRRVGRVQAD